jgi:hypothetical protein
VSAQPPERQRRLGARGERDLGASREEFDHGLEHLERLRRRELVDIVDDEDEGLLLARSDSPRRGRTTAEMLGVGDARDAITLG